MGMMATAATRATGGYSPTGAYSIEFFKKNDIMDMSLGEYFFLMGLQSLDQTYTYRMSAKATFGGTSVVDFGLGESNISLTGQIWPFYEGPPVKKPAGSFSKGASFGDMASNFGDAIGSALFQEFEGMNPIKKAGYLDFIDLVYLMHESRNPDKFDSRAPSLSIFYPNAKDIQLKGVGLRNFDSENSKMVFHDYDRDAHWEVVFAKDGFKLHQDTKDPMTWHWTLNLIGVKDVSEPAKFKRPMIPDPKKMLRDIRNGLNNILDDLSQPLAMIAGITELYHDVANLVEDLKLDLKSFENLNKGYIQKISKAGGPIKKKSNQFLELLGQLSFPNQTLPNFSSYDQTSAPITTATPPAEQISPTLPPNLTDNIYTGSTVDPIEVDLATDQTVNDMYELQALMDELSVAITQFNNSSLSRTFTYIVIRPGMTLESIASTYYGSPLLVQNLINDNGALLIGKTLQELYGTRIRVPADQTYSYRDTGILDDQYIIDNATPEETQAIVEKWLFGQDLDLDDSRDLVIRNNDLGGLSGIDSLIENLLDRMIMPKGAYTAHPDLGAMPNPGQVPDDYLNLTIPNKILQDIRSDLGVQAADIKQFSMTADEFSYEIEVNPVGGFKEFRLKRRKKGKII